MDIAIIILSIQLLIIAVAFFNLGLSIALYYSVIISIPYIEFSMLGISLPYSIMIPFYFILFYFKQGKKEIDYFIIKPYLFLYISFFLLTFVEWNTPWLFQINQLFNSFYKTCLLPIVIWNISKSDSRNLNYIKWSLIITIIISCIYGIFLTQLYGINPYTSFMASYYGVERDAAEIYSSMPMSSRIGFSTAAKIQSTMSHPMLWTLVLSSVFILFCSEIKKMYYWPFIILICINIIISGVRTGIAAILIAFAYFFFKRKSLKMLLYGFIGVILVSLMVDIIPGLSDIFISFTDVSGTESEVKGSSIGMRLTQLDGVFKEIEGIKILVGNGFNWHSYYISRHGDHPTLLSFESLIFMALCNGGIIGAVIWIAFFLQLFGLPKKIIHNKADAIWMNTLLIMYIAYTIGTGDYWYLQHFAFFYTFLLSTKYYKNKKQNESEKSKNNSILSTSISSNT